MTPNASYVLVNRKRGPPSPFWRTPGGRRRLKSLVDRITAADATVLVASLVVSTSGSEERKPRVELHLKRGVEALLQPQ
ncbi:hypothetical protein AB0A76_23995 [Streptomyces exfoliatus]|uniref:Uncharacterized protein n=1 Tax=Streptomyces exfoliatus TaxID=1905 RepID=A0ABV3D188_STREX